jgi:hypothetical protein
MSAANLLKILSQITECHCFLLQLFWRYSNFLCFSLSPAKEQRDVNKGGKQKGLTRQYCEYIDNTILNPHSGCFFHRYPGGIID